MYCAFPTKHVLKIKNTMGCEMNYKPILQIDLAQDNAIILTKSLTSVYNNTKLIENVYI